MPDQRLILTKAPWRCQTVVEPGWTVCGAPAAEAFIRFHGNHDVRPVCPGHREDLDHPDDILIRRDQCRSEQENNIAKQVLQRTEWGFTDHSGVIWVPLPDWTKPLLTAPDRGT